jgi:hypothetical protein
MLEKRMVVKAVTEEERNKRMRIKGSIGCEGVKEKERKKNASDPAAQTEEKEMNKVGNRTR